MADKLMYIPNDLNKKYPYWRLQLVVDTQSNNPTKQKSLKLLGQRIRNWCYKTLGTDVINTPMSPPSLEINAYLK